MRDFKVDFESMEWEPVRPGVRHKVYKGKSQRIRLIEFAVNETEVHWCDQGHIGYVLAGGLEISFCGEVQSFAAGDGLFIPAGTENSHRGVSIIPGTRILMVEDI